MMELSEYAVVNLICLVVLGALSLRRLVRMERFHWLRVVILTLLLWLPTICLFARCLPPGRSACVSFTEESEDFTISE